MNSFSNSFIAELDARGLVSQLTNGDELADHLSSASRTVYCGFDPTAESLHIGSLVPLLALRRFQLAGHKPIALVGGATGLIGDPSFKAQERQLNTPEIVADWVEGIRRQVSKFVDFDCGSNSAQVVNNLEWTENIKVLDFLRDVGKHFSVNNMINKESVKQRLDREGAGISFTEFSYMLLQSYDFTELNRRYNCTVQIGGSDQWGNITGGIDLTRRLNANQVFGMTLPLVTKADGSKFGKTESGTIWLDPNKTSPYAFYQFWMNTADADAYKFLRYFTFLSNKEIDELEQADAERLGRPEAQGILAREVTQLIHGATGLEAARRITSALFNEATENLSEQDLQQLQLDGLPTSLVSKGALKDTALTTLFTDCGLAKNGKQVKDALARGAVTINGTPINSDDNMRAETLFTGEKAYFGKYFIVRLGKKSHHLFTLGGSN